MLGRYILADAFAGWSTGRRRRRRAGGERLRDDRRRAGDAIRLRRDGLQVGGLERDDDAPPREEATEAGVADRAEERDGVVERGGSGPGCLGGARPFQCVGAEDADLQAVLTPLEVLHRAERGRRELGGGLRLAGVDP